MLILNSLSGSGRHQPTVRRAARDRLIDVRQLRASHRAEALARDAVHDGAQVLLAAGDGTVSAVAAVAVEHNIPLVVVPCGTRNHFAKDSWADVTDPAGELAALDDGDEIRGRCRGGQRPSVSRQRLGLLLRRDGARCRV